MDDMSPLIVIRSPESYEPIGFRIQDFMGTWYVTRSTLPLWKSRKDVTITYALKPSSSSQQPTQFDDIVEYRSKTDLHTSRPSRIVGVDTLLSPPSDSSEAVVPNFKWRGKGWLMIASSCWRILGCNVASDNPSSSSANTSEWALSYFEKTFFTPAGLDIYARTAAGLPDSLLQEIVRKAQALGGEVGQLAQQFFEVERSAPQNEVHLL